MSEASAGLHSPPWTVRSNLPGRLRLICEELVASPLLRHHCALTLTRCHWLQGFRLSRPQGSLVVLFPEPRREELATLLRQALTLPSSDSQWEATVARLQDGQGRLSPGGRLALRHGSACGLLLLTDILLPLPLVLMTGAAVIALGTLVQEVWVKSRRQRSLPAEALELAFSGALISRGLAGEALLDITLGDASEALEQLVGEEQAPHAESTHLLERLGNLITLELLQADRPGCLLKEARAGDRYRIHPNSHVYLESRVVEGDIIVLNRLVDGDWRPRRPAVGETVHPGAYLLNGQAILEVVEPLQSPRPEAILSEVEVQPANHSPLQKTLIGYQRIMTPLLLGLGGVCFSLGAVERALGVLQFNPVHDWKTSRISSLLTAMASLRLHGIHIHHPDALTVLGQVKHVVISRSCLDRLGGIETRENLRPGNSWKQGDLLRLLAGLQQFLIESGEAPIWSDQLDQVSNPMVVVDIAMPDLMKGWQICLEDGSTVVLKQRPQPAQLPLSSPLDPLEVWAEEALVGYLELQLSPSQGWREVCEDLTKMGISVHVVGLISDDYLTKLVASMGLEQVAHVHGDFRADDRLQLVRDFQANGDGVAYIGHILPDLQALSQADVSISIDIDQDSIFSAEICDVMLGADVYWLARIIAMSRRMESLAVSNFALIGGSNLVAAVAASSLWINPLTTVLLSDLPLLLAGLRNLSLMGSHGMMPNAVLPHAPERPRVFPEASPSRLA
jgi:soluble P-type ATPase